MRVLSIALFLLCFTSFASASVKIGIVDFNSVIDKSSKATSMNKDVQEKQKSIQEKFSSDRSALEKKYQELQDKKSVMTEESFKEKLSQLAIDASELEKKVSDESKKLEGEYLGKMQQLLDEVKKIISSSAASKDISIVLSSNQVVYSGKDIIDITPDVIKNLNKSAKK